MKMPELWRQHQERRQMRECRRWSRNSPRPCRTGTPLRWSQLLSHGMLSVLMIKGQFEFPPLTNPSWGNSVLPLLPLILPLLLPLPLILLPLLTLLCVPPHVSSTLAGARLQKLSFSKFPYFHPPNHHITTTDKIIIIIIIFIFNDLARQRDV